MGIIRKKSDIDYEKLKEIFQKRGHGIIAPGFLDRCNDVLDGNDQNTTIFQCECGEVFFLGNDLAKQAVDKIGSEDVPCKRCGNILEEISPGGSFVDFVKLDHFQKILNIVDEFDGKNFEEILSKVNSIDSELINATNPAELFYQIHSLGRHLSAHHDSNSPSIVLIRELISGAKVQLSEFKKLLWNLSIGEDEKNTFLVMVESNQHKFLYKQSKFFNLDFGHIHEKTLDTMDINSKLNEYNPLVSG